VGRAYNTNEKRNACRIFLGKSEGKRQVRKLKRKWLYNTKMDLTEIALGGMD
jgi:hypothetical protein